MMSQDYQTNPKLGDNSACEPNDSPADQPRDPSDECPEACDDNPPKLEDPEQYSSNPKPPASSPNCFDKLIAEQATEQAKQLSEESAEAFKTELENLQKHAKAASLEYTPAKYDALVREWWRQDAELNEFIQKLVCAVPDWRCVIECYVCSLFYGVRYREQKLWGNKRLYTEVHSLADLRYWHDRNREAKKRVFERVQDALKAWEKPAATIENRLAENAKRLTEVGKLLSSPEATKVVYDIFLRIIPLHLAIAPPVSSGYITRIAKQYTDFCKCDQGEPDDCCGPDVGIPSLRHRLVGPQPYLIDPKKFVDLICCMTKKRYLPAKNAYARAQAEWEKVDHEVTLFKAEIDSITAELGGRSPR